MITSISRFIQDLTTRRGTLVRTVTSAATIIASPASTATNTTNPRRIRSTKACPDTFTRVKPVSTVILMAKPAPPDVYCTPINRRRERHEPILV